MRSNVRRVADPVTLIGAVVSAGVGLLFYIRGDVTTALGAVAGLVTLCLVMQVQLLMDQARRRERMTRQDRLIADIEAVPWLSEAIQDVVGGVARVEERFPGSVAAHAAKRLVEKFVASLRDLERGHLLVDYDDTELVFELTALVQTTLRATSVQSVDLSFWHSPSGRQYWRLHEEALARGVDIERVFHLRQLERRP